MIVKENYIMAVCFKIYKYKFVGKLLRYTVKIYCNDKYNIINFAFSYTNCREAFITDFLETLYFLKNVDNVLKT